MNILWFTILSELFVNLAAGWFAAAFIMPVTGKFPKKLNLWLLTYNVAFGILSLLAAVLFRKVGS